MVDMVRRRKLFVCLIFILIAAISLPLLFAALRRLGLPFGLRIVPMAEDYNWLLILSGNSAAQKAQNFWAMNDRNPLSPWWYIAFDRLYTHFPNGPYLTRLCMQPLLGLSAFAMVNAITTGRATNLALGVGMLAALGVYGTSADQINWNFLGALSLSMLSVASFATWLNGNRGNVFWYGVSLLLWYCAFASYSLQVGAILGIAVLSAVKPPNRRTMLRRLLATGLETAPYPALLIAFVLAWKTTQNPALTGYYDLDASLLFQNLPHSLLYGFWPQRYWPLVVVTWTQLAWLLPILCLCFGVFSAAAQIFTDSVEAMRVRDATVVLAVSFGLVLPTSLIESMSQTWPVGSRWPMVDQAWLPLLWLSLTSLFTAAARISALTGRRVLSVAIGAAAMLSVAAALGHNYVQVSRSVTESALRRGLTQAVAELPSDRTVNLLVLVQPGVTLAAPDVMSGRIATVWFPGRDIGLRIMTKYAGPLEAGHETWWKIRFGANEAENVRIGGGRTRYDALRIFTFDGANVIPLHQLTGDDLVGYPAAWSRDNPLELQTGP